MEILDQVYHQYESLLLEAVDQNNCCGVEKLLSYAKTSDILQSHQKRKSNSVLPLVLALEKGNMQIINTFHEYHYTVPESHATYCRCKQCRENKLGQTRLTLRTLKTLSNPLWLIQATADPFLTLFELSRVIEQYKTLNDSFQKEFAELQRRNEKLCKGLLDEVRTQNEGMILMRHKVNQGCGLSFVQMALEYDQKEIVAHSVIQHFITTTVFDEIPYWEPSGILYKMFLVTLIALLWPITTALKILCPLKICSALGDIATKPFVKFVNGAASSITFLLFLAAYISQGGVSAPIHKPPTVLELLILLFLLGFCCSECTQTHRKGLNSFFRRKSKWICVAMDMFMLFAVGTWLIVGYRETYSDDDTTLLILADGAFTVGIVLAFARLLCLCRVSRFLGEFQLCLGKMSVIIAQFVFVCGVMLIAFTLATSFFCYASRATMQQLQSVNSTFVVDIDGKEGRFWSHLKALIYVPFKMNEQQIPEEFEDKGLVGVWTDVLFISYASVIVIILFNLLIALMTSTYQIVSQDITTEHLYWRTLIWMDYIDDSHIFPVPFNMIPTPAMIVSCIKAILGSIRNFISRSNVLFHCNRWGSGRNGGGPGITDSLVLDEERKYKEVCDRLMHRYVHKTLGMSSGEIMAAHIHEQNHNDVFLTKVDQYMEHWKMSCRRDDKTIL